VVVTGGDGTGCPGYCCADPEVDAPGTCWEAPEWLVIGLKVRVDNGAPAILVLTTCEAHRDAVERYQATDFDPAMVAPIEALDYVMADLRETGDVYLGAAIPA
jgi:hypothetical protein